MARTSDAFGPRCRMAWIIIILWISVCYREAGAGESSVDIEPTPQPPARSGPLARPGVPVRPMAPAPRPGVRPRGRPPGTPSPSDVDGAARDCATPQIIPSRSPSRESIYTCCEGWKLQKTECVPDNECFTSPTGKDYHGFVNKTVGGRSCVAWSSDVIVPHFNDSMPVTQAIRRALSLGGNNCRNPWSDRARSWCFVMPRPGLISWEFCDVGKPRKTCNSAKNYRVSCGHTTCRRGQICHESSRTCSCGAGYHGDLCEQKCESGLYGVDCRRQCECANQETCHHVTGDCSSSEDTSDPDEAVNPLGGGRADQLPPGNGTAMCRASCGILSRIGCTCTPDGKACKCPSYVIALFVVSVTTWVTLGSVCVVCTIRKRRYTSKIEYKRDSDYCEELDSDEETELGNNVTQPTTVTTTSEISSSPASPLSLNESAATQPLPPLPSSSSAPPPPSPTTKPSSDGGAHHVRFAGNASPKLRPDSLPEIPIPEPSDRSLESSTSSDDSHVYLNVDREESMYSIDYSHPYEFLTENGENGLFSGLKDENLEMSPECFLLQYMVQQQMRALNNAPHGYVNDSVAKWQDRKISKRLFPFGQAPFPMNANTPAAVVVGAAAARSRHEAREILQAAFKRGKPTIKPKPDVLKLLANSKRGDPQQRLLAKTESEGLPQSGCSLTDGTNTQNNNPDAGTDTNRNPRFISCQQLRPIAQKRARTVPSPSNLKESSEELEGEEMTMFSFSDDHIYENSKVVKPCLRVGQSRSADLLNPL